MPASPFTDKYRLGSGCGWTLTMRRKKPAGPRASRARSGASGRSLRVCRCSLNTLSERGRAATRGTPSRSAHVRDL